MLRRALSRFPLREIGAWMYPTSSVPATECWRKPMGASEKGPASIAEAFVRSAERSPDKLCLRFEGEEISYQGMR